MSIDTDYESIRQLISALPEEQRLSLAKDIISTIDATRAKPCRKTADRALGLLRGPQPPPDDDDIKRMIHEHRMEKYG